MYLDSFQKRECCGCGACASVCPRNAIVMSEDNDGFRYPQIKEELCIRCDLCRKTCVFTSEPQKPTRDKLCYGLKHKDKDVIQTSRSGGAFYALAEVVIKHGGAVWGAALCEDLVVRHICVETTEGLRKLQGSKYVQSDMEATYPLVLRKLKAEKEVLFSGTACQIAGLIGYLHMRKIDYSKLVTCDIVCQGVPSPKLFREHLEYLSQKHGTEVASFNFRDASRIGWEGHEESYILGSGKKHFSREWSNVSHHFMRESCFACPFAGMNRPADITLADFWGIKEHYSEFYNENGNSLVLINSDKGMHIFDEAKKNADIIAVELDKVLQPRLKNPSQKPAGYDEFWRNYKEKGYLFCVKTYGRESLKSKLVYTIKPAIRWLKHYRLLIGRGKI